MSKQTNIQFLYEGHADKVLLQVLKVPKEMLNLDPKGINKILSAMQNQQNDYHKIIVGLIDKDKKIPHPYYVDFQTIEEMENLIHKQHSSNHNQHLILIIPAIEKWILKSAESVEVLPSHFGLPDDFEKFRDKLKSQIIETNIDFKNFLKKIKELEAPNFVMLQNWINHFLNPES
jgi:hypothetical protein